MISVSRLPPRSRANEGCNNFLLSEWETLWLFSACSFPNWQKLCQFLGVFHRRIRVYVMSASLYTTMAVYLYIYTVITHHRRLWVRKSISHDLPRKCRRLSSGLHKRVSVPHLYNISYYYIAPRVCASEIKVWTPGNNATTRALG